MPRSIKYGFVLLLGLTIVACSKDRGELGDKLPKKKDAELMLAMDTLSVQSYNSFYSKISTKYSDSAQNVSFKTSLRMISDSASQILITYARIPVVNAQITMDSVHVSDKRSKCYVKESIDYIKEQFGVEFQLKDLEHLLTGLPVNYDDELKYYQMPSTNGYTICSHNKRELKKIDKGDLDEIVMYYTLSPDLQYLQSTTIVSPMDSTEIFVDYKTRELVNDKMLPKEVEITIMTPRQDIVIQMEYKKVRVNEPEQIHFVIPESYGECE